MDVVALGVRLVLALVFVVAAAGKLVDVNRTRRTLGDFGVPRRLIRPAAWLLPSAELSVAAAIVVGPATRVGAIAAAGLLILFMGGILAAMSRGEAPDCNCFGQIGSAPAGRGTLIRNTGLLALAVFLIASGPGTNPGSWLSKAVPAETITVVLGMCTVALGVAVAALGRERRTLLSELARSNRTLAAFGPGLPVGSVAPPFVLPSTSGERISLDDLRERGRSVALVFVSPFCRSCRYMLSDIARWQQSLPERLTIAVISNASADSARQMADEFGLVDVMYQGEPPEVFRAYRGTATPSVVIVAPDGRIASPIRSSQGVVENTIRTAVQNPVAPDAVTRHGELKSAQLVVNGHGELGSPQLVVNQWSGTGAQRA